MDKIARFLVAWEEVSRVPEGGISGASGLAAPHDSMKHLGLVVFAMGCDLRF